MLDTVRPVLTGAPYAKAATIGVTVVTAAWLFGRPILGIDDVWIRSLADGSYTGEPSERLIFMNSLLGWLLRGSYSLFPDVAWYALLLGGLIALSIAVVAWLALTRPFNVRIAILFVGLYFAVRPLVVLSWTETGLLVVGAGVVMVVCGPPTRKAAVFVGLLLGIGFMVRTESLGVLVAAVPLLWVARDRWRHLLLAGLVAAAVIGPAFAYDRWHYASDPEWSEWSDFERIRSSLHQTPKLTFDDEMDDVLNGVGWSKNDLNVFSQWYYADEEVFSLESIAAIHDARRFTFAQPGAALVDVASRHVAGLLVVALALWLVGTRRWWVAAASSAWLLILFTMMEVAFRSRARIEAVIVFAVAVTLLLLLHDREQPTRRVLVVALVALTLPGLISVSQITADTRNLRAAEIRALEQVDPDAVFIQVGSALALQGVSPFDGEAPPVTIVLTGWTVRSPHFASHLEQAGVDDLYLDPMRRNDVFLVGIDSHLSSVVQFIREHYGVDPLVEHVLELDGSVDVWQLTDSAQIQQ